MRPQDFVAILLASGIVVVLIGFVIKSAIFGGTQPEYIINHWADIIKILIGGLIGYMAGHAK